MCSDYSCINYHKNATSKIKWEPYLAFSYSDVTVKTSVQESSFIAPSAGLLNFKPITGLSNWQYITGLSYQHERFNGVFTQTATSRNEQTLQVAPSYDVLSVPLLVQYNFLTKKLKPHGYIGLMGNLIFNNQDTVENHFSRTFNIFQFSPVAGAGVNII